MIEYIRGILAEKEPGHVTVEAHGVGYGASIPLSTYERLPATGTEVRLLTHYHVREDGHKLFGFFSAEERMIFRQLISVSKIGPKVALNVLSGVSVQDLVASVNRSDPTRLQKISGVGAKTAQRLVMELKGKLGISPELSVDTTGGKRTTAGPAG
ncbi:MAG: Holliday junction branch migration protein RuvA, partial [Chitinispirillaceae bacterium]|nr:Holliday junction branch migration protein RuvA [Chitinispirillaceae bacterium]